MAKKIFWASIGILLAWFVISFVDVTIQNKKPAPQYSNANLIYLLSEWSEAQSA